jgi:SEC-C motif
MLTLEPGESGSFLATILGERGPETFECRLDICESPTCACSSVGVSLYPLESSDMERDETSRAALFYIDIYEKAIDKGKKPASKEDRYYANLFVSHLREEDWNLLAHTFYAYKTRLTEAADLNKLAPFFPMAEIETRGAMVGYKEILPFGEDIRFRLDDLQILVDDQYCISSGCSCTDVRLAFIPMSEDGIITRQVVEGVLVNHKTRQWVFNDHGKMSDAEKTFKTALEEQRRDIYGLLKKRHQILKKLYQNFRRTALELEGARKSSPAIGRNAPCPCGSGKKFKRCCGK